jgi:NAD(P)H dehydrogenase (quinone)
MKKLIIGIGLLSYGIANGAPQKTKPMIKDSTKILVVFHSENGGTFQMAKAIAEGVESIADCKAILKRIPEKTEKQHPWDNLPVVQVEELPMYQGIAWGSPVYFGGMSTAFSAFLSQTIPLWSEQKLAGKPSTVFMSAGSGAGKETAILSIWHALASHGMLIIPTGMAGMAQVDKSVPQGNSPYGTSSLAGAGGERPSASELYLARLQGARLAEIVKALQGISPKINGTSEKPSKNQEIEARLEKMNITLPQVPEPVGNYRPYTIVGKLVYINQIGLKEGKPEFVGKIGRDISEADAMQNTRTTLLNVLAVLYKATDNDWRKVKQTVQLTGFFNTTDDYQNHAKLLNEASNLLVAILGDKGKHARASLGTSSLPLGVPVEIQAIFELE